MDPTTVRGPIMAEALRNWSNFSGETSAGSPPFWSNFSGETSAGPPPFGPDDLHPSTLVASTFLLVAVFLVGTVGNTVIFLSAFQSWGKKLRTGFDLLIFDLTVCDFLACAVVTPALGVCLFRDPAPHLAAPFCRALVFLSTAATFMSLATLVAIALHRLTMVKSQAKRPISWRGAVLVLAGLWTISLTSASLVTLHGRSTWDLHAPAGCLPFLGYNHINNVMVCFTAPVFCISFLIVCVSYGFIADAVRHQANRKASVAFSAKGVPADGAVHPADEAAQFADGAVHLADGAVHLANGAVHLADGATHAADGALLPADGTVNTADGAANPADGTVYYADGAVHALSRGSTPSPQPNALSPRADPAQGSPAGSLPVPVVLEKESKAMKLCFFMTVSVLCCWGPLVICQLTEYLSGPSADLFQVKVCSMALLLTNSSLNPYIYPRNSGKLRVRITRFLGSLYPYQRTTRLEALGDGDLELNRNKSSHQDAMGTGAAAEPSRVDRAVGPSYTHGRSQRTPCGARLAGRLRPTWEISTDFKRSISKSRRDSYIVPSESRVDGPTLV
ncbi:probable G-protein coupled receptor 75 [Branchiostoma lanceolatum]|uniref:probable G-protein coupled receptor 75 n=1 Tax=Branchiostoma lanceolatum TaxID=7740 RepID=UPI003451BECC